MEIPRTLQEIVDAGNLERLKIEEHLANGQAPDMLPYMEHGQTAVDIMFYEEHNIPKLAHGVLADCSHPFQKECLDAVFILAMAKGLTAERASLLVTFIGAGKHNGNYVDALVTMVESGLRMRVAESLIEPLGLLLA